MIITTLSITNFGVYSGVNEFDLRPHQQGEHHSPVILIGGKNGAGKTTILEAVRLCLYGRLALGSRVRKTDYETYIKQRLHRGKGSQLPAPSGRIGLIFEHVHAGEKSIYDAVRSWRLDGHGLKESVSIYKDGQVLRDIASDYWDDFLRDLIPPGVAELFFFDGEHIQNLANTETEEAALETAIGGLLNLDIVERLQSDLHTYIRQNNGEHQNSSSSKYETISQEFEEKENRYKELRQDRASVISRLDHVSKHLEDARQALLAEGALFIEQRMALENRFAQVDEQLQQTRNQIRELASGLLPFAFTPKWSKKLKENLEREAEIHKKQLLADYQKGQLDNIRSLLTRRLEGILTDEEWDALLGELDASFKSDTATENYQIVHEFSEQQRLMLFGQIRQSVVEVPLRLHNLTRQLEVLENERLDLRQKLEQVPENEVGLPLIQKFQALSEQRGSLQEKQEQLDQEIRHTRFELDELERQRSKIWHEIAKAGDKDARVEQAAKIQVVLEAYLERMTAMKVDQLEQLVAEFFNLLCRKEHLVREVKIDPKQYSVTLYGENRTEIHKSKLSAGERQLYAMSLLWALRSVSRRSLPIIIDTPLGRLDSEHRHKLLTRFFPYAAHQIILLSTDTEVDAHAFETLKPAISHVYRLEFDAEMGRTEVKRNYFEIPAAEVMS